MRNITLWVCLASFVLQPAAATHALGWIRHMAGKPDNCGNELGCSQDTADPATTTFFDIRTTRVRGNYLYLGDYKRHAVRRIDLTTGETATWAGGCGSATTTCGDCYSSTYTSRVCCPVEMEFDATGDYLYVLSCSHSSSLRTLYKIDVATGTFTVARDNLSGAVDFVISPATSDMYALDNAGIYKVSPPYYNGTMVLVAGGTAGWWGSVPDGNGTSARFYQPQRCCSRNSFERRRFRSRLRTHVCWHAFDLEHIINIYRCGASNYYWPVPLASYTTLTLSRMPFSLAGWSYTRRLAAPSTYMSWTCTAAWCAASLCTRRQQ